MATRISLSFQRVEDELRSEGYTGTHRAMRRLRELRDLLVEAGYFEEPPGPVKDPSSKKEETFGEALDKLG